MAVAGPLRLPTYCYRQGPRIAASVLIQKRQSSELTSYKRGAGGRSSFSGIVATVLGGSGFVGRYVINKLGKIGSQVVVPYNGEPYFVQRLKLCGDLGQILFMPYNLRDEESLRKAMKYSNVVINLTGRDFETRNFSFDDVHNVGARNIARIARESGVKTLVHFSALNASPNPQRIYLKNGSKWLKSKYAGEMAVREEFPEAIIFKPSDIFGEHDRFVSYYSNWWRRFRGKVPMYKKGMETIKQPVFVTDVAQGVINAIRNPECAGQTYEIVGPHKYYLGDLVDYFFQCMRYTNVKMPHMHPIMWAKIMLMSKAPSVPRLSPDKTEREFLSDIVTDDYPNLSDLGIDRLTEIEGQAKFILKPFRLHLFFSGDAIGEFPDPIPPPAITD